MSAARRRGLARLPDLAREQDDDPGRDQGADQQRDPASGEPGDRQVGEAADRGRGGRRGRGARLRLRPLRAIGGGIGGRRAGRGS